MSTLQLYTQRKVFHRLADKLPTGAPTKSDWVRWSVEGGLAGVAVQRATHCSTYADDPDIRKISGFPDAAWDPSQPDVGARYGVVWLSVADLHHNATSESPVIAVVLVGDTLFFNITLSTTTKHITRADGEDENGVTRLMLGVLNHYPSLGASRFAEDVTRAGRDEVDWAAITGKHKTRAIDMYFGGQRYDPTARGDWLALSALGMVGGDDDPLRRRKLTGKRLMKYRKGGAGIAENQMPHGWHQKKDHHGRPVNEGDRGLVPEADARLIPVVQSLYRAHAAGESYQQIAARMVQFEGEGLLRRRDHTDLDNTYAAAMDDPQASYDSAKSFFVRSSFRPRVLPSKEAIARYLAGEDPVELFEADTRLYLAKVELMRTGRYFRRLKNDIRGRNIFLDGVPAQYRDDQDEYGWFDVLSAPWEWPLNEEGEPVERFGVPDALCRQVAVRLLEELRAPKAESGGRAHRTATRRALQRFENWSVEPDTDGARYDDEPTQWGVQSRCNNSGKANIVLLFRRASAGVGTRAVRGWNYFGVGESKPAHIAGTASLSELSASVAFELDRRIREALDPDSIATLVRRPGADAPAQSAALQAKLTLRQAESEKLSNEAKGHRSMAAIAASGGQDREAAEYAAQAKEVADRADTVQREIANLQDRIRAHTEGSLDESSRTDVGDISVVAHLVDGLERAARSNGDAPAWLGRLCDETFTDWRFRSHEEEIEWNCVARIPLKAGGFALLKMGGVVRNVRTRSGKSLATTAIVVRYLFEEGRDLTDVAQVLEVTRKTVLTQRVMPWLVSMGVTSRGAKCALVDHPLHEVRRAIYQHLVPANRPVTAIASAYQERLLNTYRDPDLEWGDAAVPDDTTWIQAAVDLVSADTATRRSGLPVLDVALALGRSEKDVRDLVKPQRRAAGFTRPRYLVYADKAKTHVKAIDCPHQSCKRRRHATHVVLLPEVAASGFGVICRYCRRTPAEHDAWPQTQFPNTYLEHWTNRGPGGSLRVEGQTIRTAALLTV